MTDAQSQAQPTRSTENGEVTNSNNPRREGRTEEHSSTNGYFGGRAIGTSRSGSNSDLVTAITGGILTQLLTDARERLGKTRECIEWYQREEAEELKRLENLEKLQQLADRQLNAEVPADHIEEA